MYHKKLSGKTDNGKKKFRLSAWYAYCVLGELVLIYPTYLIMMERSGIEPLQLAALLAIWSGTTLLFEVPSGVLGDLFNRKHMLALGAAIEGCAFLVWLIWPTFIGFALGFTIWSLGGSLASGTAEAYLYEAIDDDAQFQKVYARTEALSSGAAATALLLGGFVAEFGFHLPLVLSACAPVAAGLLVWWLLPPAKNALAQPPQHSVFKAFLATLEDGIRSILRSSKLIFLILAPATIGALLGTFEEFIGVIFTELETTLASVGVIYAGVWFARTIGSLSAEHIKASLFMPLLLMLIGTALLVVVAMFGWPLWIAITVMFIFAASGILDVIYGAELQAQIDDNHRATVTSTGSMGQELIAVGFYFAFGLIAAEGGIWFNVVTTTAAIGLVLSLLWMIQCRLGQHTATR